MFRVQAPSANAAEIEAKRKKKVTEMKQNAVMFVVTVVALRLGNLLRMRMHVAHY